MSPVRYSFRARIILTDLEIARNHENRVLNDLIFLDCDLSVCVNLLFRQQLNGMEIHSLKPKHGEIHLNQQRFAGLLKATK